MNKKYDVLINKLQLTLDDYEVKENQELTTILITYKNKLENGDEYNFVCTKLTNTITNYLLTHKFKAPKSVLDLYNSLENKTSKYRGLSAITNWI
ncbi:bacteriocin immunity protein [Clostridium thermobutyricum]|uniref:bacteriocin immunity protein n=1 Tax=Clostridium thermobutyricum TaxID=29372 RepID=UPI0018AB77B6|nr:bacteriocin immunity protein [Clostridium thermobutyricum]